MDGPFTPHMFGFDPSVKGYAPDPARARRLLAEAGYPDCLQITREPRARDVDCARRPVDAAARGDRQVAGPANRRIAVRRGLHRNKATVTLLSCPWWPADSQ